MPDPLDLLLCPGCGASVEPTLHPAEDDYPAGWSAECGRCGYDLSGGNICDGDPPTLRRILAGATVLGADDVDIGAYTRAVARALGVLS